MCFLSCRLHRPEQNRSANVHCETKHYLEFLSPQGFIWREKQGHGGEKRKTRKSDLTLRFKRAKQFFMHLMVTNGQGIRSAPCQDPLLQMCSTIGGVGGQCPVPSHLLLQIKTHTHTKQGFSECDLKPVPTRLCEQQPLFICNNRHAHRVSK